MSENWTPQDEDRLRRALLDEAAQVVPSSGGLERILARTRRERPRLWWLPSPAVLGVAGALLAAVAVIGGGLAMLGDSEGAVTADAGRASVPTTPAPSPTTTSATADPTREPAPGSESSAPSAAHSAPIPSRESAGTFSGAVAVYYLTDTSAGPRLVREWRHLSGVHDAPTTAVELMLGEPKVRDYRTPWDPETTVRSVRVGDDAIDVDLSLPDRPLALQPQEAELAIQQLVYTVTAAASVAEGPDEGSLPVRIRVDGDRVDQLLGVDVSEALTRAPAVEVRQLVQLNDPSEGAEVSSPVQVRGEALVFEANVHWEIQQNGEVVAEGNAPTADGLILSEFSFEVELDPGEYTLVIREEDASGGEGLAPMTDERRFTVID